MAAKTLLLFVAIFFTTDARAKSGQYRRPSCGGMSETQACPLNYSPVCGTDGITYPNECALCVQRLILASQSEVVEELRRIFLFEMVVGMYSRVCVKAHTADRGDSLKTSPGWPWFCRT